MKKQPDNINATVGPEPEKKIVKKRKKKGYLIHRRNRPNAAARCGRRRSYCPKRERSIDGHIRAYIRIPDGYRYRAE